MPHANVSDDFPGCEAGRGRVSWIAGSLVLLVAAAFAAWSYLAPPDEFERQRNLLVSINRSEDLIQELVPEIRALDRAALDLSLPGVRARGLFAPEVTVYGIDGSRPEVSQRLPQELAEVRRWSTASHSETSAREDLDLWRPFLDVVTYFDTAGFYLVRGAFQADGRFQTDMGFAARAYLESDEVAQVSAKLSVTWVEERAEGAEEAAWRIEVWKTKSLEFVVAPQPLFAETLDAAVPDAQQLAEARRSRHEELIIEGTLAEEFTWPEHFKKWSQGQHPGVSVADVDRDGHDDFYVMPRRGKNMLFRNRGDGTFEDVAPALGLDLEDHTTSAVFADFDNDGDSDVFLGRTMAASRYLVNEDGKFVDRSSELIDTPLPAFVSSAAAADYDGDGLLDVYLSTYSVLVHMPLIGRARKGPDPERTPQLPLLSEETATEFYRLSRAEGAHVMRNAPGPPNVLLRNAGGGRFELVEESGATEVWHHTFQSTFGDYDRDGDPDLYVANDFAPNNLLRNDGGRFTDVTDETGTADIGFGMGVAWGDYDNDGAQDLYVTNMYSKAGRRIIDQIDELDWRLGQLAGGNTLLRNGGERFERVSGTELPSVLVEKAGWSWGGQFLDFNNDGFLDLYALSGYYTAPAPFRVDFDT